MDQHNVVEYRCLLMESLLIANDLDSTQSAELVVDAPHYLSETSFTKHINHLVAFVVPAADMSPTCFFASCAGVILSFGVARLRNSSVSRAATSISRLFVDNFLISSFAAMSSLSSCKALIVRGLGGADVVLEPSVRFMLPRIDHEVER
ncbi:hypothetical protein KCU87_g5, partial [Aureobasidium melanogenum]